MGIELARLFMAVSADTAAADSALTSLQTSVGQQMRGVMEGTAQSIDGTMQATEEAAARTAANIKRIFTGILGFVSTYAGAGMLKQGLFAAGQIEQDTIAFETLLGSAEETQKLIADLTDFAAKTPFEMPQIKTAARGLVTFGERGDELMKTLNILGNAAAGTSSDFGMLALIFNQVRGVGKLLTQDFRQLSSRGVISLQEIADYYGVTTAAAQEMLSKGKITFEDLKKILASFSEEGGKFFKLMERQSGSFLGVISTLKDTINITMAAIGEGIRPIAVKIIGAALPLLEMIRAFVQMTGPLAGNIVAMTTATIGLTTSIVGLRVAMTMMGITFRQVLIGTGWGVALVALGVSLGAVITAVQKLYGWLVSLKPVQDALTAASVKMTAAWDLLRAAAAEIWTQLAEVFSNLRKMVLDFFGAESAAVLTGSWAETVASMIGYVADFVLETAKWINVIVTNFNEVWDLIQAGASLAWAFVLDSAENVWNTIPVLISSAWDVIQAATWAGVEVLQQAWLALVPVLTQLWTTAKSVFTLIYEFGKANFNAMVQTIVVALEAAVAAWWEGLNQMSTVWGVLLPAMGEMLWQLVKVNQAVVAALYAGFLELFKKLPTLAGAAFGQLGILFGTIPEMIKTALTGGDTAAVLESAVKEALHNMAAQVGAGLDVGGAMAEAFDEAGGTAAMAEMGAIGLRTANELAPAFAAVGQAAADSFAENAHRITDPYNDPDLAAALTRAGVDAANLFDTLDSSAVQFGDSLGGIGGRLADGINAAMPDITSSFDRTTDAAGRVVDEFGNLVDLKNALNTEAVAAAETAAKAKAAAADSKASAAELLAGGSYGFAELGRKFQENMIKGKDKQAEMVDLLTAGNKKQDELITAVKDNGAKPAVLT